MQHLTRLRLLLARRPWLYWLAVGATTLAAWSSVRAAVADADAQRAGWGATVTVWVATAPAALGEPLPATARRVPVAVVPAGVLTSPPAGPAARAVGAGEILTTLDVAGGAVPPAGAVVVAVPAAGAPRVAAGSTVLLLGNGTAVCDGVVAAPPGADTLEVAVPGGCAADLAAHLAAGTVLVARRD